MASVPVQPSQGQERTVLAAGFPATMVDPSPSAPIVLFIAGSGPTDRDGNSALGVRASYLAKLAEELGRKGIASLRYDKRGLPASAPVVNEAEITLVTFVQDASSVLDWLQTEADGRPVLILGHSEGGLIALEVARNRPEIAGIVLVATPGVPLGQTLRNQLEALPAALAGDAERILELIETGAQVNDVPDPLLALFRPSVQPFLATLLAQRPAQTLVSLAMPVLVVGGGNDLQVGRSDFDALSNVRPDIRSWWFPKMNHILVDSPEGRDANIATYSDPSAVLTEGLADLIVDFAQAR